VFRFRPPWNLNTTNLSAIGEREEFYGRAAIHVSLPAPSPRRGGLGRGDADFSSANRIASTTSLTPSSS
jgi:hypothetical protein